MCAFPRTDDMPLPRPYGDELLLQFASENVVSGESPFLVGDVEVDRGGDVSQSALDCLHVCIERV